MTKKYSKNFIIQQSAKLFYYKGYKNTELTDIFKACEMLMIFSINFFPARKNFLLLL